ncbi:PepSY-like domain-containing protein [Myroides odoratus]|uniref:PepSY-like domain-containing protein n=1 Tax=Myroides odoratus TaxID=256 RepID=UPI0007658F20|nr:MULTISPECIES: PepSY-like domain-containing protein [Myroides]WHT39324.1 PepSY-like domain-containing protein [Myroides sp. mNGS23_01]
MKTVRTLFLGIISVFALVMSQPVQAKDVIITKNELPKKALAFMDTHFNGKTIQTIEKDADFLSVSYKVTFADRIEIEFDKGGEWDEVDGNKNPLPTSFILEPIVTYVKTNYPDAHIVKIEKETRLFEVKLDNGLELEFAKSGAFKRIDN